MKWAGGFSGWFLQAVWLFLFYMKAPEVFENHCHPSKNSISLYNAAASRLGHFFDILQLGGLRSSLSLWLPFPTRRRLSSPTPGDQISIPPLAERTWWYIAPGLQLICSQLTCSLINPAEDKRWPSCSCYLFKLQSWIDPANVALRSPAEKGTLAQNGLQSLQVCGLLA